ncbi:hypothetical protein ACVWXM_005445 [Bradyrhizobium sp. GM7.3]
MTGAFWLAGTSESRGPSALANANLSRSTAGSNPSLIETDCKPKARTVSDDPTALSTLEGAAESSGSG